MLYVFIYLRFNLIIYELNTNDDGFNLIKRDKTKKK